MSALGASQLSFGSTRSFLLIFSLGTPGPQECCSLGSFIPFTRAWTSSSLSSVLCYLLKHYGNHLATSNYNRFEKMGPSFPTRSIQRTPGCQRCCHNKRAHKWKNITMSTLQSMIFSYKFWDWSVLINYLFATQRLVCTNSIAIWMPIRNAVSPQPQIYWIRIHFLIWSQS